MILQKGMVAGMASQETPRAIVLEMLLLAEKEQEFSNQLSADILNKYDYFKQQDKAFINRLFTGCVERRIELDHVINSYAGTKTNRMKPVVRNALRMGVYQLLYMDRVPESAACNETVRLVRMRGLGGLAGFVNGTLRSIARNLETLRNRKAPETEEELSIAYSMPEWIVNRLIRQYGRETAETVMRDMLQEKPVTIRMDERLNREEQAILARKIADAGILIDQHPYLAYAYTLQHIDGMYRVPGFAEGQIQVADVSSMLVAEIAGVPKGGRILDTCAAPGGKTLHVAAKLGGTGSVLARDVSEYKVGLIRENVDRMQYTNVTTQVWDATVPDPDCVGKMDVVIVDAPCSGLGVIGKKADIKYHTSEEDIRGLSSIQRKILSVVQEYVKPGGTLIYSTCTWTAEENRENRRWFLEHYAFEPESIDPYIPEQLRCGDSAEGHLQFLPGVHRTDGFYISRFRRCE